MEANKNKYIYALGAMAAVGAIIYFGKDEKKTFDSAPTKKRKAKRRAGAFARMESAGTIIKKNKKEKRK